MRKVDIHKLGLRSAKMPFMGGGPRQGGETIDCNFLVRIIEDSENPNAPKTDLSKVDYSPLSEQHVGQPPARNQEQWIAAERRDVQQTLQGLVISPNYGAGDASNGGFGNDGSNSADTGLSPDTASNRLTPNSTTPSDTQQSRAVRQSLSQSQPTSFETSPVSTSQQRAPPHSGRTMGAFFSGQPDYTGISASGLTPEGSASLSAQAIQDGFAAPETPGRGFEVPNGWEMGNSNAMGGSGMTPIGEGVFRHLMGLGSMDPM